MTLYNFLAKNGFIRNMSEIRRISEQERVLVNGQIITPAKLNQTDVVPGDQITVGKNVVKVFEGP